MIIFLTVGFFLQRSYFERLYFKRSYLKRFFCNGPISNGYIATVIFEMAIFPTVIFFTSLYIYAYPPSWFPHQIIIPSPTEMSSLSRLDSSSSSDDDDELILSALHIAHTQCPILISTCLMSFLFMLQDIPTMQQSE